MATITKFFTNWKLSTEMDIDWKMKPLESAKTNFTIDNNGVFVLTIEHDILSGVSPKMLHWWFQNIGGDMNYRGKVYSKYLLWHPKDHIHWSLKNSTHQPIGMGSYFRIVEAFNRDTNYLIDSTELVEKLDETGIRLVKKLGENEIFSLQHDFIQEGINTLYKSKMIVGTNSKFLGLLFNSYVRPLIFTKDMGSAWLKHNIEEVGNFEFFLPELYYEEINK